MPMEPMLESYNANSALQATCQSTGNPLLKKMAARYAADRGQQKFFRIADFGCSGGRNSHEPMRTIISSLPSTGVDVECILEDLPTNPWHQVMAEASRLTEPHEGKVQVLCAGTSFYDRVCGEATLDLAYSYVAVHFLSDTLPMTTHVLMHECAAEERQAWSRLAASDWEKLLLLRARELKKGGKMMLSTMSRDEGGYSWQKFSHLVWDSIREAGASGRLSEHAVSSLCIPACLRSESEIMAPFAASSEVGSLFDVDDVRFALTEVQGEREWPTDELAPHIRRRVESVWGGMFVSQMRRLGERNEDTIREVMRGVWNAFEEKITRDPLCGWLDMRCFYLEVTRK